MSELDACALTSGVLHAVPRGTAQATRSGMFFVERSAALCSLVPPAEGPRWSVEHWGTDKVDCPACRKALAAEEGE